MDSREFTGRAHRCRNPVIRLDRCAGAVVRASKAFAGAGTFLSTDHGGLKQVVLEGNVVGKARKATEESAKDYWQ